MYGVPPRRGREGGRADTSAIRRRRIKENPLAAGIGSAKGGEGGVSQGTPGSMSGVGVILGTVALSEILESDPETVSSPGSPDPGD